MNEWVVIGLVLSHFVGDFLLQSDEVAINKSKNNIVLLQHVLIYGLPFLWLGVWFYVVTVALHFIVDYGTSRWASYMYSRSRHWFFVIVGFDQLLHMVALILTYKYLIGA